jgi:hypothetical protein
MVSPFSSRDNELISLNSRFYRILRKKSTYEALAIFSEEIFPMDFLKDLLLKNVTDYIVFLWVSSFSTIMLTFSSSSLIPSTEF